MNIAMSVLMSIVKTLKWEAFARFLVIRALKGGAQLLEKYLEMKEKEALETPELRDDELYGALEDGAEKLRTMLEKL